MAAKILTLAALAALVAVCAAQTPDLAGFQTTALAPFADALESNGPLALEFASTPLFGEALSDPPTAAGSDNVNAVLNDPSTLQALRTSETIPQLLAALSPSRALAFEEFVGAPTTGNVPEDLDNFDTEVSDTDPTAAAGSRKLLRA